MTKEFSCSMFHNGEKWFCHRRQRQAGGEFFTKIADSIFEAMPNNKSHCDRCGTILRRLLR